MLLLFVLVALCSAQWLHRAQLWREDVARRMRNQFGAPKSALGSWSAPTLFVPGHTLSASSWDKAVAMGTRGGNGAFAAVFSGRDNRFHISGADGRVLSDREAASTRMFIVDFKDVFASAKEKSLQIIAAAKALQRVLGGGGPVRVNVVTHSAGDFDFDTAVQSKALDNVLSVNVRVAIGPVFDGTYVGTLGGSILVSTSIFTLKFLL
jgi:hypothetical protein